MKKFEEKKNYAVKEVVRQNSQCCPSHSVHILTHTRTRSTQHTATPQIFRFSDFMQTYRLYGILDDHRYDLYLSVYTL